MKTLLWRGSTKKHFLPVLLNIVVLVLFFFLFDVLSPTPEMFFFFLPNPVLLSFNIFDLFSLVCFAVFAYHILLCPKNRLHNRYWKTLSAAYQPCLKLYTSVKNIQVCNKTVRNNRETTKYFSFCPNMLAWLLLPNCNRGLAQLLLTWN